MTKYYYHLVRGRTFKKGDELFIGEEGYGGWNDVYESAHLKKLIESGADKQLIMEEYDYIIRELAAEEVRQKEFPDFPCRLRCLWLCEDIKDCQKLIEPFRRIGANVTQIIKASLDGKIVHVKPSNYKKSGSTYNEYKEKARKFFTDTKKTKDSVVMFMGKLKVEEVYPI